MPGDVSVRRRADTLRVVTRAATYAWGAGHTGGVRARAPAIAYWLGTLRYVPNVSEIRTRLGCSRATAYRWHRFAADAAAQMPEASP